MYLQCLRKMSSENGQVYSVCILQFSCFTKYNRMQSRHINNQNENIADETLIDYSILRRYHYTKSKNYFKRWYRIRHWIPMFIGTPCTIVGLYMRVPQQYSESSETEHWTYSDLVQLVNNDLDIPVLF